MFGGGLERVVAGQNWGGGMSSRLEGSQMELLQTNTTSPPAGVGRHRANTGDCEFERSRSEGARTSEIGEKEIAPDRVAAGTGDR